MSSTRMQVVPDTSPITFITSDSPARSRRLSMMASGALMRLASPRARTTPPTSGETTVTSVPLKLLLDVAHHDRRGEQVVGRDVEEALDLPGMQIDGEHAVRARIGDQVRDQLRRDRRAARCAAVLPRIAEIRDDRRDAPRRGAPQRIHDDQQLHQVVVRRERGRLQHEHVGAAHVLLDLDEDLHVGEAPHLRPGQRGLQIGADRLRRARDSSCRRRA